MDKTPEQASRWNKHVRDLKSICRDLGISCISSMFMFGPLNMFRYDQYHLSFESANVLAGNMKDDSMLNLAVFVELFAHKL